MEHERKVRVPEDEEQEVDVGGRVCDDEVAFLRVKRNFGRAATVGDTRCVSSWFPGWILSYGVPSFPQLDCVNVDPDDAEESQDRPADSGIADSAERGVERWYETLQSVQS